MSYVFQWAPVWDAAPQLAGGALVTLELTVLSSSFGLAIGLGLALMKRSPSRLSRAIATPWVGIARNTPSLLQIYLVYFGLGAYRINVSPWFAVLAAITFNTAGYMGEIIRGGFAGVNPRQYQAAVSLGMSTTKAYSYIVLPQVFTIVFLPLMNQVILALMGTSLGMIIGLNDLAGVSTVLQSITYRPFEFYIATALIYYILVKAIVVPTRWAGARMLGGR